VRLNGSPGLFDVLDKQVSDYQDKLSQAEGDLAKFREDNRIVSLAEEKNLALQRVASLEKQVLDNDAAAQEQEKRRGVLESQLGQLDPRVTKEIKTIPNQYSVERLNTLVVELRNKRTDLVSKYKADDRTVTELDRQISDTQSALDTAKQMQSSENTTDINPLYQSTMGELSRADAQLAGTVALSRALKQELATNRERLHQLDRISAAHEGLTRKVRALEESYMASLRKREDLRASEVMDSQHIGNVAVVQAPYAPDAPSWPNRPLIFSLGFVWAVLMTAVAIAVACALDRRVRTPAELEAVIGIPVLATVPYELNPLVAVIPVASILSAGRLQ
jgi:uncharacterized protein involved in exopolysaccharide biosynthesis